MTTSSHHPTILSPAPPAWLAWLRRLRQHVPALLLGLAVLLGTGCAALQSLLGPAVAAAGAGLGAYEAELSAAAKAKGIPSGDPAVLQAIADAKRLAEKRAAEDRARDEAERAQLEAIKAKLGARPACTPAPAPVVTVVTVATVAPLPPAPAVLPLVDAGAPDARAP